MSSHTQYGSDIVGGTHSIYSGRGLALNSDGTIVAIGSPWDSNSGKARNGTVKVFQNTGGGWSQLGSNLDNGSAPALSHDALGGYSVALNAAGTRLIYGIWNGQGSPPGYVKIYDWNSGSSSWDSPTVIAGDSSGDRFGRCVSMSDDGTRIAVGAAGTSKYVKMYQLSGGTWSQIGANITVADDIENPEDYVAMSSDGNYVIIGEHLHDEGGNTDIGRAHVYAWNQGTSAWDVRGTPIVGVAAADYNGWAVDINSDGTIIATASVMTDGNNGRVVVYKWNGSDWAQHGSSLEGDNANDQYGWSISLSNDGERILVGAKCDDDQASNAGKATLYEMRGDWIQVYQALNGDGTDDQFGFKVRLSNDGARFAIAAPYEDSGGNNSGHVKIFNAPNYIPCFLAGTKVSTPDRGHIAIEKLHKDDVVYTHDGRVVPVSWVAKRTLVTDAENSPYCIPRNYFGTHEEVWVSPDHAIATDKGCNTWFIPRVHGAKAGLKRMKPGQEITYYNLTLPNWLTDHFVVGKKMAVESCGERFHRELGLKWPLYRVSETHKTTGLYKRSMGDYTRQKHSLSRGKGSIVEFI